MIDANTKSTYDTAIARAAADRDIARHERDSLQVENMALKATLRRVCAWCEARGYDVEMPDEMVEEILVVMDMVRGEAVTK